MKKKSILFTVPAFLIYTVLMIIPIAGAFLLSFTDWNGISAGYHMVGIKNYVDMLSDERLRNAIFVTLKITMVVAASVNILGLLIAMLLNRAKRLTNVFRSIFSCPMCSARWPSPLFGLRSCPTRECLILCWRWQGLGIWQQII